MNDINVMNSLYVHLHMYLNVYLCAHLFSLHLYILCIYIFSLFYTYIYIYIYIIPIHIYIYCTIVSARVDDIAALGSSEKTLGSSKSSERALGTQR